MKKFYSFLFLLLISAFINLSKAQIANFCFTGSNGDETQWPSATEAAGIQPLVISRGPGVAAAANADRFNSKNWPTGTAPDLNDYIEFTITPKPGYGVTVSSISLQHQRSLTGPRTFVIRTSFDGFAADATNVVDIPDVNTNQQSTFTFPLPITTSLPLTIRIYAYNAETSSGTWGPGESMDGNDINIAGSFLILPIRFVNVKASWRDKDVQVEWLNATESDLLYYTVERSVNGQDFHEIARLNPSKNNGAMADYKSTDFQPQSKINYYRIKGVETSGNVIYSKIVKIEASSSKTSLGLYPNPAPAGSQIMLQLNGLTAGDYKIAVYNAAGQLIDQQNMKASSGALTKELSVKNLQRGVYVVEVSGSVRMQQRFIIQ